MMNTVFCTGVLLLLLGAIVQASDDSIPEPKEQSPDQGDIGVTEPIATLIPWYFPGKFVYENGYAKGSSLHFYIDEVTGTITDYTVKFTFFPNIYYQPLSNIASVTRDDTTDSTTSSSPDDSSVIVKEYPSETYEVIYKNVTIFDSITVKDFSPFGTPKPYATYLAFQGKNVLLLAYDQEGGYTQYAASDQDITMIFKVKDGFTITQSTYDFSPWLSTKETLETSDTTTSNSDSGAITSWQNLWIKSDNTVTTLNIQNGAVAIDGQTIEVTLKAYSTLDLSSWVEYPAPEPMNDFWFNDLKIEDEKGIIEEAKINGAISAEGWCTAKTLQLEPVEVDGKVVTSVANVDSDVYTYKDPTFTMDISSIDTNKLNVVVNSEIPTGRIVIVNIQKDILQYSSLEDLLVKMDDSPIDKVATIDELMKKVDNQDTDSAYYLIEGVAIDTVLVYVSHFSTHTITIESVVGTILSLTNLVLPLVLATLFIGIALVGLVVRHKKQKDDF